MQIPSLRTFFLAAFSLVSLVGCVPAAEPTDGNVEVKPIPVQETPSGLLEVESEVKAEATVTESVPVAPKPTPTAAPKAAPAPVTSSPQAAKPVAEPDPERVATKPVEPEPVAPSTPSSKYSCAVEKTCGQMTSCEEAYYHLNVCGYSKRDGDDDGVPCEDIC